MCTLTFPLFPGSVNVLRRAYRHGGLESGRVVDTMGPHGQLFAAKQILCTGIPLTEKGTLCQALEEEGATLLQGFLPSKRPDVVITRSVLSESYNACRHIFPSVPAVTPEWAAESIAGRVVLSTSEERFRVRCFTGLNICLSGLPSSGKQAMVEEIVSHGGKHSPSLDRRCTHLVTITTESDKYR